MAGRDESNVDSMESSAESDEENINTVNMERSKSKPGIIYLSSIPHGFNVSQTTAFFSEFGRVGRVFLQPGGSHKRRKFE